MRTCFHAWRLFGTLTISSLAYAQSNDMCAGALPLRIGTDGAGSTRLATLDGASACVSLTNRDVWFEFIPPLTAYYHFDTCGSAFDTVLSLHRSCPDGSPDSATIACNDDSIYGGDLSCTNFLASSLVSLLHAGTATKVRIAGYWMNSWGDYQVRVAPAAPPNDSCAAARLIVSDVPAEFSTCYTRSDIGGHDSCGSGTGDVWFRCIAFDYGAWSAQVCDADFDPVIEVFGPDCAATGEPLACSTNSLVSCESRHGARVNFGARAGAQFLVRVSGAASGGCGGGEFRFVGIGPCPPCTSDYNQDGGIDGSDIGAFFKEWEAGERCSDVNQDGGIDGSDVQWFFALWEAGAC